MKNIRFLSVVILAAMMLLNACNFPLLNVEKTTPVPNAQLALPTETSAPICPDISSYGKLYDHWPGGFELVSTTPELTWFYTPAISSPNGVQNWANECVPDSYTVYLSTGPDFTDEIAIPVTNPVVYPDPTKLTLEWTIPGGLEPMKVYRWTVIGYAHGTPLNEWRIADLHDDSIWPPLNTVNMTYKRCTFRTGPECASGQIDTPLLTYPVPGEVLNTLTPILLWEVDSCMPRIFLVQISTTPEFLDPQFYVNPGAGGDYTWTSQRNYPYAAVNYALRDCTKYYWRVQGGIFTSGGDGEWGAYSEVRSFSVDLGHCPTPTATLVPPTHTPTPTETPKPFTCAGLSHDGCTNHSDKCEWYQPVSSFNPPYCRAK
jgi:hypothetical protein